MLMAADLLAGLVGRWTFDRVIAAEGASMIGEASFTPEPDGRVLYQERGVLTLRDGRTGDAHRRYRFGREGDAVVIDFADGFDAGRRFVSLRFAPDASGWLTARALHPCGPDMYDVLYRLDPPDAYETDVVLKGPRKDYRIVTRFRRQTG